MIFACAYCSLTEKNFSDEELIELADHAAGKNEKLDISGYLYYRDYVFLQYLEGEKEAVKTLMKKIEADPRHTFITSVVIPKLTTRQFPHWYMRFLGNEIPRNGGRTLEEELSSILEMTSKRQFSQADAAFAIEQVTRRIAGFDW